MNPSRTDRQSEQLPRISTMSTRLLAIMAGAVCVLAVVAAI